MKSTKWRNVRHLDFYLAGIALLFVLIMQFMPFHNFILEKPKIYIAPPEFLPHLTFGYNEIMADSLWIRLIQDIEICGKETQSRSEFEKTLSNSAQPLTQNSGIEADESLSVDRSIFGGAEHRVCQKGWAFHLLDAITELVPRFRMPYSVGASALSVLTNDHIGAKIIFDKGVKQFPNDWIIHYRAAYHYLYELRDLNTAAHLLYKAGDLGAPSWVKSLAARLYTRTGQALLGLAVLQEYYKTVDDPELKKKVETRIRNLQRHLRK